MLAKIFNAVMGNCMCFENLKINGVNYRIRECLGEGGFSLVYLVENLSTHKLYAMKKIVCHSTEDQKIALEEIEHHKKFSSCPYVIDCLDSDVFGTPNITSNTTSQVLIILPFCKLGTLHDELMVHKEANTRIHERRILVLFRKICEGVHVFHSSDPPLAHRDLKTSNILLQDESTPLIMDLGSVAVARVSIDCSKDATKLQDEASERCSMPYRAPELFNIGSHSKIDERSDVWSLGCLLYALCFYQSPFDDVHARGDSVALAVIGGNIHFPQDNPYSEDLISLIHSMLQIFPHERPFVRQIISQADQIIQKLDGVV